MNNLRIQSEAFSLRSIKKTTNEDRFEDHCFFSTHKIYRYIVVDGMTQPGDGDLAANNLKRWLSIDEIDLRKVMIYANDQFGRWRSGLRNSPGAVATVLQLDLHRRTWEYAQWGDTCLWYKSKDGNRRRSKEQVDKKGNPYSFGIPRQYFEFEYKEKEIFQDGDCFLLCSDGILKIISDSIELFRYFSEKSLATSKQNLQSFCEGRNTDDATAIMIKVYRDEIAS